MRRSALRPEAPGPARDAPFEPTRDRAWIGVGSVRHVRSAPVRHAFRYPACFVRLPMRHLDEALREGSVRTRLFARNPRHRLSALWSFHDADHGDPSFDGSLAAWIDGLLAEHGVYDADGSLWLQTFPRILGYAFKPVSFWFCHRADGALRAVVCEVNNTFGERHCYLLAHRDGRPLAPGEQLEAAKVFHVSPFCSVSGSYRFRFHDTPDRTLARIDYDAEGRRPLIATSLSGRLLPMTTAAVAATFLRMPLFSLGVIARIHWQALRLWIKHVPYFAKPTPPAAAITR
jgi:DUF1365 family protein